MNMDDLFAMGFCKAAEEHGVDPVQLAKYAADNESRPEFKTDGYAPKSVADIGTKAVPLYRAPYYNNHTVIKGTGTASPMEYTGQLSDTAKHIRGEQPSQLAENPAVTARAKASPEYLNWLLAHMKATKAVADAARGTFKGDQAPLGVKDPELNDILAKLYHGKMFQMTNATPVAVSSPVK